MYGTSRTDKCVCAVLYLDEPTTGLDAATSMSVLRLLKRLAGNPLHPPQYTLRPTPYTLHPTPCTLRPTPFTVGCRVEDAATSMSVLRLLKRIAGNSLLLS